MAKEKSCGALVWRRRGKDVQILILRHRMGGHWSFPKGHVERDETEVQTALREVHEETGLRIELADGFREQVSYSPRPGVTKDVVYFLGYAADSRTKRQEEEISEIRWVDVGKIQQFLTYDNDRTLIRNATRFMRKRGDLTDTPPNQNNQTKNPGRPQGSNRPSRTKPQGGNPRSQSGKQTG